MASIVLDTMKKAVGDILPLPKALRKKHKTITDAIAECEMAFGPEGKITKHAADAELKLRAAAELTESAGEDLLAAVHLLAGAVPNDGAQIRLFTLEEGGFRIVVENANPPADPNSETSTDSGGAFEKPHSAKQREELLKKAAADPNQLSIEETTSGDTVPADKVEWPPETIAAAKNIEPKLSDTQREIIQRLSVQDVVTPKDLSAGEKNSIKGLQRRKVVRYDEAANRYSLLEIGWTLADFLQGGQLQTEAK